MYIKNHSTHTQYQINVFARLCSSGWPLPTHFED